MWQGWLPIHVSLLPGQLGVEACIVSFTCICTTWSGNVEAVKILLGSTAVWMMSFLNNIVHHDTAQVAILKIFKVRSYFTADQILMYTCQLYDSNTFNSKLLRPFSSRVSLPRVRSESSKVSYCTSTAPPHKSAHLKRGETHSTIPFAPSHATLQVLTVF